MAECKECSSGYEVGIRGFCSDKCLKVNIQKRIDEATVNETSHTTKLTKEE